MSEDAQETPDDDTNIIISDFWCEEFERMRNNPGYWINNQLIVTQIYRLISGTSTHWLPWLLNEYFADIEKFSRVLSICCGDGAHEETMLQSGKIEFLHAFDISQGALQQAQERLSRAGISQDQYKLEVQDVNALTMNGHFDLVVSAGAVHHVTELEGLFEKVASMLFPSRPFVLLEYVGPNRFQWTDRQIDIINRILDALDERYLHNGTRTKFTRPTIEEMIRMDPSEAIRSKDILKTLGDYFDIDYRRDYNGTIIHQLYPLLNHQLALSNALDFQSIVRLILLLEDLLIKSNHLESDFTFVVCHPKKRWRTNKFRSVLRKAFHPPQSN